MCSRVSGSKIKYEKTSLSTPYVLLWYRPTVLSSSRCLFRVSALGVLFRCRPPTHRTCRLSRTCTQSVMGQAAVRGGRGPKTTYASANEAGRPRSGRVTRDRSRRGDLLAPLVAAGSRSTLGLLRAKPPDSARPTRRSVKPTRNWLPLPTVGRKGAPGAVAQISLN